MKKTLFSMGLVLCLAPAVAQTSGQVTANMAGGGGTNNAVVGYLLGDISQGNQKRSMKLEEIQGSAYTTEIFLPAKLFYKDEYQGDVFYRYNAYYEEIEIKAINLPGAEIQALSKDKNLRILDPSGRVISFKTYVDGKGLTQNGYLTKFKEGKYSLYQRVDVKFTEGMKSPNSFVPPTPPRFSQFTQYYLEIEGNNRMDEIQLGNRKLMNMVNDEDKSRLKTFLKENNIKIKSLESMNRVLDFLNS